MVKSNSKSKNLLELYKNGKKWKIEPPRIANKMPVFLSNYAKFRNLKLI